jgi:hypothetical protein
MSRKRDHARWLKPFWKDQGRIIGPFFVETLQAVKEAAGFTFGDDDSRPWPKDVFTALFRFLSG